MLVFPLSCLLSITGECLPSLGGFPWRLRQEGMLVAWTAADASEDWLWKSTFLVHYHLLEKMSVVGYWRGSAAFTVRALGSAVAGAHSMARANKQCCWGLAGCLCHLTISMSVKSRRSFHIDFPRNCWLQELVSPSWSWWCCMWWLFSSSDSLWDAFGPRQPSYERMLLIQYFAVLSKANICLFFFFFEHQHLSLMKALTLILNQICL